MTLSTHGPLPLRSWRISTSRLRSFVDAWARIGSSQVAIIYALREEPDRVFEWLDRAWETRDTGALTMPLTDPFLLKYEADPRFTAYAVKAGLLPAK